MHDLEVAQMDKSHAMYALYARICCVCGRYKWWLKAGHCVWCKILQTLNDPQTRPPALIFSMS